MSEQPRMSRVDLDALPCPCGRPTCKSAVRRMVASCHPESGTKLWYDSADGCITLVCGLCSSVAARIQVASQVPS